MGWGYSKGDFRDLVLESYAGPHDMANSHWFYDVDGTIKSLTATQTMVRDRTTNYTTSLLFATPFAAAAVIEQTNLQASWPDTRHRGKR